jgi:hypothetical protein
MPRRHPPGSRERPRVPNILSLAGRLERVLFKDGQGVRRAALLARYCSQLRRRVPEGREFKRRDKPEGSISASPARSLWRYQFRLAFLTHVGSDTTHASGMTLRGNDGSARSGPPTKVSRPRVRTDFVRMKIKGPRSSIVALETQLCAAYQVLVTERVTNLWNSLQRVS